MRQVQLRLWLDPLVPLVLLVLADLPDLLVPSGLRVLQAPLDPLGLLDLLAPLVLEVL